MKKRVGRPRKAEAEKVTHIYVGLCPDLLAKVDRQAKELGLSRSTFLAKLVKEGMNAETLEHRKV